MLEIWGWFGGRQPYFVRLCFAQLVTQDNMESNLAKEKRFRSLFGPGLGAIVHGEDAIGHRLDIVNGHSERCISRGWLRNFSGFPSVAI